MRDPQGHPTAKKSLDPSRTYHATTQHVVEKLSPQDLVRNLPFGVKTWMPQLEREGKLSPISIDF